MTTMTGTDGQQARWLALVMVAGLAGCGAGAPGPGELATGRQEQDLQATRPPVLRFAKRVQWFAEGSVDPAYVLPAAVPPPPPGTEWRARHTFPVGGQDVLEVLVFLAPLGAPTGGPSLFTVSQLRLQVDRFERSTTPAPNLAFSGRITETPVPSPFGPVIGRLASISAGYTPGPDPTFTLVGGAVAGSHATFLPLATGSLRLLEDEAGDRASP